MNGFSAFSLNIKIISFNPSVHANFISPSDIIATNLGDQHDVT